MTMTPFIKMHGAGNDFVIFDGRHIPVELSAAQAKHVADRHFGVGCDQVIVMEPSQKADVFMRIYNADGGEVNSCGNASRCVAWLIMQEHQLSSMTLETLAGVMTCNAAGERQVTIDMGEPKLGWKDIPLSQEMDTLHLDIEVRELKDGVGVNMGNPHAVFFVENAAKVNLGVVGPLLENHSLFPERANISVAQVIDDNDIRLNVWERGAGMTLACGTAACATAVAAGLRKLVDRSRPVSITLPGGTLRIEWKDNHHVMMTGPVATAFTGTIDL